MLMCCHPGDYPDWGERMFHKFDTNGDGKLSSQELCHALKALPPTEKKVNTLMPWASTVESLIAEMGQAGDFLTLDGWLRKLDTCVGLADAIATGQLAGDENAREPAPGEREEVEAAETVALMPEV